MRIVRSLTATVAVCLVSVAPSFAQSVLTPPPVVHTLDLSGPRFGLTFLSEGIIKELHDKRAIDLQPTITQFGWQFERQFLTRDSGVTAVSEYVVLLGGLDQGVAIPSLSWLVGMRTRGGAEFGVGPNITPAGVGLVIAVGVTYRVGAMNIPINFALVPSKYGQRLSVMTGFNMRNRK
ncbi:MAG: hypothetical protein ABI634_05160 [Acidobacteriota bacterium]